MSFDKSLPPNFHHVELNKRRIGVQELAIKYDQWQTCVNCDHWDKAAEVCDKFGKQRPPAYIIVTGCQDHVIEIPF